MKRGDLIQRLFVRFAAALLVAFALLIMLFHVPQARPLFTEWQNDLQQEALWPTKHTNPDNHTDHLMLSWERTHRTVRFADSHPQRDVAGVLAAARDAPATRRIARNALTAGAHPGHGPDHRASSVRDRGVRTRHLPHVFLEPGSCLPTALIARRRPRRRR